MLFARRRWIAVALFTLFCFGFSAVLWPVEEPLTAAAATEDEVDPPGWERADLDEVELRLPVPDTYAPGHAGFTLQYRDEVSPYRITSLFAMPGETVEMEVLLAEGGGAADVEAGAGTVERTGPGAWRYTAPETPGHTVLRVRPEGEAGGMLVNVFVKTPWDGAETLNGYRIGQYEAEPLRGNQNFARPEGFVEVTPEMLDVRVSPHFKLGQFLCKQESGWPKYTLVRERLLLKLEMLLEQLDDRGIDAPTLFVMSAFRTPHYNAAIGNRTTYSVHLYGGAADVFVDTDGDAYMDDLDGDGAAGREEAARLAAVVEDLTGEAWYAPFIGGLGLYGPAPHRGPFIHVDVRGERARW